MICSENYQHKTLPAVFFKSNILAITNKFVWGTTEAIKKYYKSIPTHTKIDEYTTSYLKPQNVTDLLTRILKLF